MVCAGASVFRQFGEVLRWRVAPRCSPDHALVVPFPKPTFQALNMKSPLSLFLAALGAVLLAGVQSAGTEPSVSYDLMADLAKYNVIWDSPSQDYNGTMPLGNGDISVNAWIEPSGDLIFYIGKTDSWGDNARLLKVGRVRVSFSPHPLKESEEFKQTLNLEDALIEARYGDLLQVKLWVDANHRLHDNRSVDQRRTGHLLSAICDGTRHSSSTSCRVYTVTGR